MSPRFDHASLAGLDEPVRRYLAHAIADGAELSDGVVISLAGRIDVGRRLAFTAEQEFRARAFTWRARAGWGRFKPLHVVDRYADGAGSTDGRLLGRIRFLHAADEDTARSAAGRAALESIWVPGMLLPERGVGWRAVDEQTVVAALRVPPEDVELTLRIDPAGAPTSVSALRWGNAGQARFGHIPCGGDLLAQRRFGDVTLPSRVSVGWWYGTPRFEPFYEATVLAATRRP